MAKIRYVGDTRRTFTWTNMGKTKSYSISPGKVLDIPSNEIPYLLSFGSFQAIWEETVEESTPIEQTFRKTKEDPIVREVIISSTHVAVETPVVVPVVESPVVAPVVVELPNVEPEVEEKVEEDKVDYTSLKKSELKKLCGKRGLDTYGNRDDLIANLVTDDRK